MKRVAVALLGVLCLSAIAVLLSLQGCSQGSVSGGWGQHDGSVQNRWGGPTAGLSTSPLPPDQNPDPRTAALAPMQEEVWFITKPTRPTASASDDRPGCGAMVALVPGESKETTLVPMPLKHTDVSASIAGYIATVDVTQQFHNPFDGKIEAEYVFPLPDNAAVSGFIMTIGQRRIRGIIREREEAVKLYREARAQGYTASLLTEERPNIFTQRVANIEPGKEIDVHIRYFHTLSYDDGWFEFVFPMVVGPRYNPPALTTGVAALPRHHVGPAGQPTAITYLRPTERSGHDVSVRVDLHDTGAIEEIRSPSHAIVAAENRESTSITLEARNTIPNRDFVLRYRLASDKVKSTFIAQQDDRGGYFTLMLLPPKGVEDVVRQPVEMVFLLDCSGSMTGQPLDKVKAAVLSALDHMDRGDSFNIVRFSNEASSFAAGSLRATADNVQRGKDYVRELNAGGGTEMLTGIRAALGAEPDGRHPRPRIVALMTDGFIGNETEIFDAVYRQSAGTRVFSFGVGSAPNRYLIENVARAGRGAAAYVGPEDDGGAIMDRYQQRAVRPALTNLRIDWGDLKVSEVFPAHLPDLFVGRPVVLAGRFAGTFRAPIIITGTGPDGREVKMTVAVSRAASPAAELGTRNPELGTGSPRPDFGSEGYHRLTDAPPTPGSLPAVWARMKIADLATRAVFNPTASTELSDQIRQVALEYGLMSAYTAFIAVDASQRTAGDHGVTVPVAVPVPAGARYDTNVPEN